MSLGSSCVCTTPGSHRAPASLFPFRELRNEWMEMVESSMFRNPATENLSEVDGHAVDGRIAAAREYCNVRRATLPGSTVDSMFFSFSPWALRGAAARKWMHCSGREVTRMEGPCCGKKEGETMPGSREAFGTTGTRCSCGPCQTTPKGQRKLGTPLGSEKRLVLR